MKNTRNILAALCVLFSCGYSGAADKLNTSPLVTLTMPDGSKVAAELALTPQSQARGLMFREELPDNAGMIFVFKNVEIRTFWMKNTFISLDIVFLDAGMKVQNIFHRVPRSSAEQPESEVAKVSAPAKYVLELAAGKARKCGLKPGSVIKTSFSLDKPAGAARAVSTGTAVSPRKPAK